MQDRPHRRLPARRSVVMDWADRILTSKICVTRPLGVLAVIVRADFNREIPSTTERVLEGSGLAGGLTRHVIQSTVLSGAARVPVGTGSLVHHQTQLPTVT